MLALKKTTSTLAALVLCVTAAFATTYECTDAGGCWVQRIKEDGTLGPRIDKALGERLVINDGDYSMSSGWTEVVPS